jgi:hypothetical protein
MKTVQGPSLPRSNNIEVILCIADSIGFLQWQGAMCSCTFLGKAALARHARVLFPGDFILLIDSRFIKRTICSSCAQSLLKSTNSTASGRRRKKYTSCHTGPVWFSLICFLLLRQIICDMPRVKVPYKRPLITVVWFDCIATSMLSFDALIVTLQSDLTYLSSVQTVFARF